MRLRRRLGRTGQRGKGGACLAALDTRSSLGYAAPAGAPAAWAFCDGAGLMGFPGATPAATAADLRCTTYAWSVSRRSESERMSTRTDAVSRSISAPVSPSIPRFFTTARAKVLYFFLPYAAPIPRLTLCEDSKLRRCRLKCARYRLCLCSERAAGLEGTISLALSGSGSEGCRSLRGCAPTALRGRGDEVEKVTRPVDRHLRCDEKECRLTPPVDHVCKLLNVEICSPRLGPRLSC